MRKLLLTSFVFVIMTASLSAQTEYGVKTGFYNSERNTNISFNNDGLKDFKTFNGGFYIGAFASLKISERFYIQPEVMYAYIKNDFDQLQIPVLGRYRIGKKFNIFLGPNFGFLLTDNENFDTFNFAFTFGVSYDITKRLSIDLRYNWALSESLNGGYSADVYARFSSSQIGLTYRLD